MFHVLSLLCSLQLCRSLCIYVRLSCFFIFNVLLHLRRVRNVQYGLYSSFVGCFVYAMLGTSKDIAIGPVAIISLLVSSFALSPIPGDATYAIIVSLVSGAIQLLIGFLHIGESRGPIFEKSYDKLMKKLMKMYDIRKSLG